MAAVLVICAGAANASTGAAARSAATRTGGDIRLREAAQVTRNDRADVTFELLPATSGSGVSIVARSADLQVTKTVQPNGDFAIDLAAGEDKVTIVGSAQGATVSRGRSVVALRPSDSSEEPLSRVRRLLAESTVVVKFRAVAARLIEDNDRSHEALALILADATVGLLTGDVAAPRRIARFLVEGRLRNVRNASMAESCFELMETRMVEAWNDYGSCYYSTAYNSFYQYLCSWRWTIEVESYWFNFLSCTGFNFS
jgi:hypothetical protein